MACKQAVFSDIIMESCDNVSIFVYSAVLGTSERAIQCMRLSDTATMPLSYCTQGNIETSQSCNEPCPRHCVMTDFTEWSVCSASCGFEAIKSREKKIKRRDRGGGRKCPERTELTQVRIG